MEVGHQENVMGSFLSLAVMKKEMSLDCKVYAVMVEIITCAITHAHLWPGFSSCLGHYMNLPEQIKSIRTKSIKLKQMFSFHS